MTSSNFLAVGALRIMIRKAKTMIIVMGQGLLVFALNAVLIFPALAAPLAAPIDGTVLQPDGYVFSVRQMGDGNTVWYETRDGYTVMRNEQGEWVYAVSKPESARVLSGEMDSLLPSSWVVGRDDPKAAKLIPHLKPAPSVTAAPQATARAVGGVGNPITGITGTARLLVVLGYYDDALAAPGCPACATTNPETFQQTLFATDRNSVAHYFNTMSHGALTLIAATEAQGTPNDGIVGWVRLGASTPEGKVTSTSVYKSNRIAADAINAAQAYVDFTAYDTNNDGRVRSEELALLVIVAGYESSYGINASGVSLASDTTSPRMWGQSRSFSPSSSGVSVPTQTVDGRTVSIDTRTNGMTYSIVGELHGAHAATMGIMTHELGHSLFDLPDLYDTSGASNGVGVWSSMSYGSWGKASGDAYAGETPVALDAWSRVALGWVIPTAPASGSTMHVHPASTVEDSVILLPTARGNEYFLVENRQNSGYDAGLWYFLYTSSFGGVAVWHIDDSVGTPGLNNDNANSSHRRVDLVAASGDSALDARTSYGAAGNLFYEGHKDEVSDATSPHTHLYDGATSGVTISQVSFSAPDMTFIASYAADAETSSIEIATEDLTLATTGQAANSAASGGGGGGWDTFMLLIAVIPFLRHTRAH